MCCKAKGNLGIKNTGNRACTFNYIDEGFSGIFTWISSDL